jgi:hypothetical protein
MIVSVHLASIGLAATPGVLRHPPNPSEVPGLRYAETTITAPLSGKLIPALSPGRVGLIAAWEDDAALDEFSANHPLAAQLSGGWQVRLSPLRVSGAWSEIPDLPAQELPVTDQEPVAVMTLGKLRFGRAIPFLRASARAEGEAIADPALLASTGLARPPRLVATFSLWRSAKEMRDYAHGRSDRAHPAATRAHAEKPFHRESAFVRFRPYASQGIWGKDDPLGAAPTEEP